ncbi:uncharacterized protein LOC142829502 [Pelodiscus sinensis]|uniref:uncharacterized protein LOC142829502 n=1 Tax=Pelodiscus sinensis TaxID=13735 RepID=UPI003F6C7A4A
MTRPGGERGNPTRGKVLCQQKELSPEADSRPPLRWHGTNQTRTRRERGWRQQKPSPTGSPSTTSSTNKEMTPHWYEPGSKPEEGRKAVCRINKRHSLSGDIEPNLWLQEHRRLVQMAETTGRPSNWHRRDFAAAPGTVGRTTPPAAAACARASRRARNQEEYQRRHLRFLEQQLRLQDHWVQEDLRLCRRSLEALEEQGRALRGHLQSLLVRFPIPPASPPPPAPSAPSPAPAPASSTPPRPSCPTLHNHSPPTPPDPQYCETGEAARPPPLSFPFPSSLPSPSSSLVPGFPLPSPTLLPPSPHPSYVK